MKDEAYVRTIDGVAQASRAAGSGTPVDHAPAPQTDFCSPPRAPRWTWTDALAARKDSIGAAKDIISVLAVLAAGIWTVMLTSQYRDTAPRLSTAHEVRSWRLPDGRILVRIQVEVNNAGKVLVAPVSGILFVQPLMPLTPAQQHWLAANRLVDDCVRDDGALVKGCVSQQGIRVADEDQRPLTLEGKDKSLEPGEANFYWKYLILAGNTTTIEVYTFIANPKAKGKRGWARDSVVDLKPS